jgi:hypothetical protein
VRYGDGNMRLCVRRAAGVRRAVGGGSNDRDGDVQAVAAACGDVWGCAALLLLW